MGFISVYLGYGITWIVSWGGGSREETNQAGSAQGIVLPYCFGIMSYVIIRLQFEKAQ